MFTLSSAYPRGNGAICTAVCGDICRYNWRITKVIEWRPPRRRMWRGKSDRQGRQRSCQFQGSHYINGRIAAGRRHVQIQFASAAVARKRHFEPRLLIRFLFVAWEMFWYFECLWKIGFFFRFFLYNLYYISGLKSKALFSQKLGFIQDRKT